ncbi:GNAT family N-acetyltransferase [Gorillibacterium timonense]|uniref:GNAT family N-acetyltransferase n=1 Tax=Gorillibacterium timonense TaxID=1689269 RepID=UPI00071E011C|nr:GNAT family protein [Gorillibacterium timonense]
MTFKLPGDQVSLMTVRPEDASRIAAWLNDLEVTLPLGGEAYTPIYAERMRREIESDGQSHSFLIIHNESGLPIGRCLLFSLDFINNSGKLGIFIGDKEYWNKGYGKEALTLLLDYGFNLLNLNSMMLGVFAFNEKAIRCYHNVGFKEIGRLRQARLIAGHYHDAILMDILAGEFTAGRLGSIIEQSGARSAENTAE